MKSKISAGVISKLEIPEDAHSKRTIGRLSARMEMIV